MSATGSGIDLLMKTPRETFDPRSILDVVADHWPRGVYQDAAEEVTRPLAAVVADEEELQSREFFVYRDEASARSWEADGKTTENSNRMVHFLIQEEPSSPDLLQVTMVIDEYTGEMSRLYASLGEKLEPPRSGVQGRKRPSRVTIDAELRAAGCRLSREQFYELVEQTRRTMYPEWTQDELACHPHEALRFCEIVRTKAQAPLPDHIVMKALLNYRKRGPN